MFARAAFKSAMFAGTSALALVSSTALAGGNNGTVCSQPIGPDVIVGDIMGTQNYTAEQISGVWHDAFSFGTSSCNIGNQNLRWFQFGNNQHPAISQNLFKYKVVNGVGTLEQLGQSWLKHGFTALTQNICGCGCASPGTGTFLGVGCSDPYTATRNGGQGNAGPKWQVNANAGYFPLGGPANPSWTGSTARRLRVRSSDIETTTATVRFFAECMYVSQDDAAFGNKNNNASHREVFFNGGPTDWSYVLSGAAITQREKPGIMAWKAIDPAVTVTNVVTPETPIGAISGAAWPSCCTTGLVIVAAKATDMGGGITHFEYAVQNLNSDRSIASFSVPLAPGVQVSNIGFHDVDYHSNDGEGNVTRDGADWPATVTGSSITWSTVPFSTNPNSNALRWGSMYNFRFDANVGPASGDVTLGTYKVVGSVTANTVVPAIPPPPSCNGDTNSSGAVDVNDMLAVINAWGPCDHCAMDFNGDGQINVLDLLVVVNGWGPCP